MQEADQNMYLNLTFKISMSGYIVDEAVLLIMRKTV